MKNYTKRMAQQATKNQMKASYVNVWEFISGEKTDRETAKAAIKKFANEQGIYMSEVFEEYNAMADDAMKDLELSGYFCF